MLNTGSVKLMRSFLSMQRVDFFLDFYPTDAVATCTPIIDSKLPLHETFCGSSVKKRRRCVEFLPPAAVTSAELFVFVWNVGWFDFGAVGKG